MIQNKISSIIILSMLMLIIVPGGAFAWRERLEECARLGYSRSECPDDKSILKPKVPPVIIENKTDRDSDNKRSHYQHSTWVNVYEENGCYVAFYRVINTNGAIRTFIDFPERIMYACDYAHIRGNNRTKQPRINVVSGGYNE